MISGIGAVGALFGSFISKELVKLGKIKAVHIINVILLICYALSMIDSIPVLIVCRFFEGLASAGISCSIVPQLIYEMAPVAMRGNLGGLNQLSLNSGILLVYIIGYGTPTTSQEMLTSQYWRVCFIFPVVIIIIQTFLLLVFFNFDSPYYLLFTKQNEQAALVVLKKQYHPDDAKDVLDYMKQTNQLAVKYKSKQQTYKEALLDRRYCKATLIGSIL